MTHGVAGPSRGDKNTMDYGIAASAIPKEEVALDIYIPSLATEGQWVCLEAVGNRTVCAAMQGQEALRVSAAVVGLR